MTCDYQCVYGFLPIYNNAILITQDMAEDAGVPFMEGQLYPTEWRPCFCDDPFNDDIEGVIV